MKKCVICEEEFNAPVPLSDHYWEQHQEYISKCCVKQKEQKLYYLSDCIVRPCKPCVQRGTVTLVCIKHQTEHINTSQHHAVSSCYNCVNLRPCKSCHKNVCINHDIQHKWHKHPHRARAYLIKYTKLNRLKREILVHYNTHYYLNMTGSVPVITRLYLPRDLWLLVVNRVCPTFPKDLVKLIWHKLRQMRHGAKK